VGDHKHHEGDPDEAGDQEDDSFQEKGGHGRDFTAEDAEFAERMNQITTK
jgi:hypothetical protein